MASVFYETMGINYVLPVAECDLNISSKQQYGIISGIWFAGELDMQGSDQKSLRQTLIFKKTKFISHQA